MVNQRAHAALSAAALSATSAVPFRLLQQSTRWISFLIPSAWHENPFIADVFSWWIPWRPMRKSMRPCSPPLTRPYAPRKPLFHLLMVQVFAHNSVMHVRPFITPSADSSTELFVWRHNATLLPFLHVHHFLPPRHKEYVHSMPTSTQRHMDLSVRFFGSLP
ncbi:hypothetical protein KP509_08G031800 [Ceratopteris richardii]|uniref:Uncharacterized protein n=1 Tax=Ceratopteris richardii TaxID=49495 RepID=A0A8T2UB68_CERRI|nr:hypothetical protein KP509_08G031800 [Ceratopteris richardii]